MPGSITKAIPVITYQGVADTLTNNIAASGAIAGKESLKFITTFNYNGTQGIESTTINNLSAVGGPTPQTIDSYFSIAGQGLVMVKDQSNNLYYTRNGSFDIDGQGKLTNILGYHLQAYPVNPDGTLINPDINSLQNLQTININNLVANPTPTSNITNVLQLPASAQIGPDSLYNQTVNVYDSLGEVHSLNFAWEKTANQTWQLTVTDPQNIGTVTGGTGNIEVAFDATGAPSTFNGLAEIPELTMTWSNGAATSNINLNLGAIGSLLGVISAGNQLINRTVTTDGNAPGDYEDLCIGEEGFVSVIFSNGEIVKKYKIPVANFPNVNGLQESSASVYQPTGDSGNPIYNWAGQNGVGSLNTSTLEGSSVDTTTQYLKLLTNQMIYQANVKALHVEKEMWGDLNNI